MNSIERAARKFATQFDFDEAGHLADGCEQETTNAIFDHVCGKFAYRLPPERLLNSTNEQFDDCHVGDWAGRENRAARTMQTIFDRAYEIAESIEHTTFSD